MREINFKQIRTFQNGARDSFESYVVKYFVVLLLVSYHKVADFFVFVVLVETEESKQSGNYQMGRNGGFKPSTSTD